MNKQELIQRALNKDFLSAEEGQFLFENVATTELMWTANELRQKTVPGDIVTWEIDRNVNTTNACVANCKFCNFFRPPKHPEVYITTIEEYKRKIEETIKFGGDQILLQGGHHPVCLHGGANDMGSIMLEENVVSVAGAPHRFTSNDIQDCIRDAGFEPQLRNQEYNFRELPENLEQQVIDY